MSSAKPEFVGHSLWLIPNAEVEKDLEDTIQKLAVRLDTPPFLPHATLLGGVVDMNSEQATETTRRIASRLRVIDAEISAMTWKELLYFQCVFGLLVPSDELVEAHRIAKEEFGRVDEPEFMPHISLIYDDLSSGDRMLLAQELSPRFDGVKMKMEKLQLWNTTGVVASWRMVAEFPLAN